MLRLLLLVVFLAFLITLALSNSGQQSLCIVYYAWQIPLETALLALGMLGFFIGALFMFPSALLQRRRARRAEQKIRAQETQIVELHQRIDRLASNVGTVADPSMPTPSTL